MAMTIRTCDGDILDTICHRHYGHLVGTVEAVLEANPGLAQIEQPLPAGTVVFLPDLPPARRETVRLWS